MFKFETINNKKILKSDLLTKANGFFTTRESVITQRDLPELEAICSQNRELIARYLKIKPEQLISPVQTHSANIAVAKEGQIYPNTDALVVIDTNIAIALNFADCTPVIYMILIITLGLFLMQVGEVQQQELYLRLLNL